MAQIPAAANPDKLTLIVEPLTALMHEQVEALQVRGIAAAYLDSTQSKQERSDVLQQLRERELTILYLSPERLNPECLPHEIYANKNGRQHPGGGPGDPLQYAAVHLRLLSDVGPRRTWGTEGPQYPDL